MQFVYFDVKYLVIGEEKLNVFFLIYEEKMLIECGYKLLGIFLKFYWMIFLWFLMLVVLRYIILWLYERKVFQLSVYILVYVREVDVI